MIQSYMDLSKHNLPLQIYQGHIEIYAQNIGNAYRSVFRLLASSENIFLRAELNRQQV